MLASQGLRKRLAQLYPDSVVTGIKPLYPDAAEDDESATKGMGYGRPLQITIREGDGTQRDLVFRTATANDFDHDRRSDRAKNIVLAYDTFSAIPNHVRAIDTGAIADSGELISIANTGEFYLLTDFAAGDIYAADLRRIAAEHVLNQGDRERCERLVAALVEMHAAKEAGTAAYRRSIRNLVGDGEGIFGMIDGYPRDTPAAPAGRLKAIEERCVEWRWKLRGYEKRCSRIHGDFHPFNILFEPDNTLHLLDASRGCQGDPADDVTALAINYLFAALDQPGGWDGGLRTLWNLFWDSYMKGTGDREVLNVAPPFFAWRALVLANPRWYPDFDPAARDALLGFVEHTLDTEILDPDSAEALFA